MFKNIYLSIFTLLILAGCSSSINSLNNNSVELNNQNIKELLDSRKILADVRDRSVIDSVFYNPVDLSLTINCNNFYAQKPFREDQIEELYFDIKTVLNAENLISKIIIFTLGKPIEELVPNLYREKLAKDQTRKKSKYFPENKNVKTNLNKPFIPVDGLFGNNIALWHSHGWYYNHKLNRWMWQRARLFQIVEDLGPMAFTVPYIIPMLENSGANVFVPRERDINTNEIVIDDSDKKFIKVNGNWKVSSEKGFAKTDMIFESGENPFTLGHFLFTENSDNSSIEYKPEIPEDGTYALYISYNSFDNSSDDILYTVYHSGGKTEYSVNQKIGGGTWIYLDSFEFKKGSNPDIAKVVVSSNKNDGKIISTDAIKLGGGMGVISRNGRTSDKPKYIEGARYWLQYAGMPDSLIFSFNGDSIDYKDDYQSRGEWVNYLLGYPYGPNKDREAKGLGIPIDLSFAFHTDAGITRNDTVIGTLAIYSLEDYNDSLYFPDGTSRYANRDLTDIVQTQIVDDIKYKYDPVWNRRGIREAGYSEAIRPNVPATLLELLSHQNFLDVKFQSDPRFRFDVSRSIYKAFVKFIAEQENRKFVIQPLPVTHFSTVLNKNNQALLSWKPQNDPIESTANAENYIVYTKIGNNGFDNGVLVSDTSLVVNIKPGLIYSFKVSAVNKGGESFPSEELSLYTINNDKPTVLIINGFDRVCGPAIVETNTFSGFMNIIDEGVPDRYDLSYTGEQYNFNPESKWITDDMPGHGASYADYETKIIAGNTFNYSFTHGSSIAAAGYSFVSVSDEAVIDGKININDYKIVNLILGEEKETQWPKEYTEIKFGKQFNAFPAELIKKLDSYLDNNGSLFLSGSYIASELYNNQIEEEISFAKKLGYKLSSEYAVKNGNVFTVNENLIKPINFSFNNYFSKNIYKVEAPNAIEGIYGGKTFLRYSENKFGAGTYLNSTYKVVAISFPFETILSQSDRNVLMKEILNLLNN